MVRLICGLILVLLIASPSMGQQSLVGTYKFITQVLDIGGTLTENMGKVPKGCLVVTPTRVIAFFTAENRKFGTSMAEKAALLDTLVAWSGTYRIEGSKIIIAVDNHWTEVLTGKNMVRNWELSGNRLTLRSDPEPYARDPSKTVVVRTVWEKVE
jgi:hypothetical protein